MLRHMDSLVMNNSSDVFLPTRNYIFIGNQPISKNDLLGLTDVDTGIEEYAAGIHVGLVVSGTPCGYWPKGENTLLKLATILPFVWLQGHVYVDDADPTSTTPYTLDDCEYDISKFQKCVASHCTDHDEGHYNVIFHNCFHWQREVLRDCRAQSKR